MKKTILILMLFLCSAQLFAQDEKYISAMKKNISLLDSARQNGTMVDVANSFERIGDAEKTQWLPYYYAAYCCVSQAFQEEDKSKTDGIADRAEQFIVKAEAIAGKENSETAVIKSMIASSRLMVDPQNRWMQYGKVSTENIQRAKELDPTNPRPYYLEAQSKFYTPESFGGGKSVAKPIYQKAIAMFDTFKPQSEIHPTWGKAMAEYFLSKCD